MIILENCINIDGTLISKNELARLIRMKDKPTGKRLTYGGSEYLCTAAHTHL